MSDEQLNLLRQRPEGKEINDAKETEEEPVGDGIAG